MGWSLGYDSNWNRDIGYGVPCECDYPGCTKEIDRGLSHVCGGEPYGGEDGCGLFFCSSHLYGAGSGQRCERCVENEPFSPFKAKPDIQEWIDHKMTDPSWEEWRNEQKIKS